VNLLGVMRKYPNMNAVRLQLLLVIYGKSKTTLDDIQRLTGLSRNTAISHLRVLETDGLVSKQRGRKMRYRVTESGEEVVRAIKEARTTNTGNQLEDTNQIQR